MDVVISVLSAVVIIFGLFLSVGILIGIVLAVLYLARLISIPIMVFWFAFFPSEEKVNDSDLGGIPGGTHDPN